MRTLRDHLRVVFGKTQPEAVINTLRKNGDFRLEVDSTHMDRLAYRHFSMDMLREHTYEEIDALHHDMVDRIRERGKTCGKSVFALLPEYTLDVLKMDGFEPVCRQNQLLNWRYCYLYLGQDLLTTSYLAYIDFTRRRTTRNFIWPSQVRTDDMRLADILSRGIAENHFHLNGSTRLFDMSWICLMNYPMKIKSYTRSESKRSENSVNNDFEEDLNGFVSYGIGDNRLSWDKRIAIACWIRVMLFLWINNRVSDMDLNSELFSIVDSEMFEVYDKVSEVIEMTQYLSKSRKFKQLGEKELIIDYAINYEALPEEDIDHCCRSLTGERALLYHAFYWIYSGKILNAETRKTFMDLLYLYILIKTQFRSEMIQVNDRYGFKNFAKYQDRKDLIFSNFPQYRLEAKNLSVIESMTTGNVCSLEMRIGPAEKIGKMRKKIKTTDNEIHLLRFKRKLRTDKHECSSLIETGLNCGYFYVLHFPKIPEKEPECVIENHDEPNERSSFERSIFENPRNYTLRKTTRRQAFAIAEAMQKWDWLCTRIRGIDACTYEIGCRPEVFATEFRFLRDLVLHTDDDIPHDGRFLQPKISATYHVGEDFLDIIDGLRAVDEAVKFLEMQPGERFGHALALGVDPKEYYELKHWRILISKQDMLDNIVWSLNKTKELGIAIDCTLYRELQQKAEQLIYEIYGKFNEQDRSYSLYEYYNSWKLRGDDPYLYQYDEFDNEKYEGDMKYCPACVSFQYYLHRIGHAHHRERYANIRENAATVHLYYMYHFNPEAKRRGRQEYEYKAGEEYMKMAYELQEKMMQELAMQRIGIECNPSSNVLIGPFKTYENHPVFRFYPPHTAPDHIVQYVSINTDDQGVFDTSLNMEYALLASSMRRMKKEGGGQMYNEDTIYGYLERLRQSGISQTFPKTPSYGVVHRNKSHNSRSD